MESCCNLIPYSQVEMQGSRPKVLFVRPGGNSGIWAWMRLKLELGVSQ